MGLVYWPPPQGDKGGSATTGGQTRHVGVCVLECASNNNERRLNAKRPCWFRDNNMRTHITICIQYNIRRFLSPQPVESVMRLLWLAVVWVQHMCHCINFMQMCAGRDRSARACANKPHAKTPISSFQTRTRARASGFCGGLCVHLNIANARTREYYIRNDGADKDT